MNGALLFPNSGWIQSRLLSLPRTRAWVRVRGTDHLSFTTADPFMLRLSRLSTFLCVMLVGGLSRLDALRERVPVAKSENCEKGKRNGIVLQKLKRGGETLRRSLRTGRTGTTLVVTCDPVYPMHF